MTNHPPNVRPYRSDDESGEVQITIHPETHTRVTWRHVGFIGKSGAFYGRSEEPADFEEGFGAGYKGLWVIDRTEPATAYDFAWALARLREGMKVTRNSWEPYGQFVVLQKGYPDGIGINANTAQATGLPEGERRVFRPYLMLHCADLSFVPWQPTVSDVLAEDWMCATTDGTITWPDGTVA